MTPGQWGFIHNEWITRDVEVLSLSSEGSRVPGGFPDPFQKDTDTLSATSGVEESKDEVINVPLQAPHCKRPDQINTSPEAEEETATGRDEVPPATGILLTGAQYVELMRKLESVEKINKSYSDISTCYDRLLKAYQERNEQLATLQRNLTDMGPQVSKIASLTKRISDVKLLARGMVLENSRCRRPTGQL